MDTSSTPLVSVIIATYNASHVLGYAIKSVLQQSYANFELLIIGDCCTDGTEQLVAEFDDDRIQFYNLEKNSGQQATPNNFGLKKARGEYIAFLNQDDLYFPDHLYSCLEYIRKKNHQIICVPYLSIAPASRKQLDAGKFNVSLFGFRPNGEYTPISFHVASSWFFKKSVIEATGYWKTEKMTYETPSQEWLFRAWKKGISIGFLKKITLLVLFTGKRKDFYKLKNSYEHDFFYTRLQDPNFVANLFEKAAIYSASEAIEGRFFEPGRSLKRLLLYPFRTLFLKLGINPRAVKSRIAHGKKGMGIKKTNKRVGLDN